jgi:hypothetical protein
MEYLGLDRQQALQVRRLLHGDIHPDETPAGEARVRECYHRPSYLDLLLRALNDTCGTYGVEPIFHGSASDWPQDLRAEYLNTGDSYSGTLLYDYASDAFSLTCWGSYVEVHKL